MMPSPNWSIIHRTDGDHLCIRIQNDEVIMVRVDCSVYYPFEESIEPTTPPDKDTLASILAGVSREALQEIGLFCTEPRTMVEVEERFPGVEAWRLRHLGYLKDVGKRGRRIVSEWHGYDFDDLLGIIYDQYNRSKERHS